MGGLKKPRWPSTRSIWPREDIFSIVDFGLDWVLYLRLCPLGEVLSPGLGLLRYWVAPRNQNVKSNSIRWHIGWTARKATGPLHWVQSTSMLLHNWDNPHKTCFPFRASTQRCLAVQTGVFLQRGTQWILKTDMQLLSAFGRTCYTRAPCTGNPSVSKSFPFYCWFYRAQLHSGCEVMSSAEQQPQCSCVFWVFTLLLFLK